MLLPMNTVTSWSPLHDAHRKTSPAVQRSSGPAQLFFIFLLVITAGIHTANAQQDQPWVQYRGAGGPGSGKHVVLISGDEEYRSEEALPQLGKILAKRHGFNCTVLFPIDPNTGNINPDYQKNIPGTAALKSADLMIIATRFRDLPDKQMTPIDRYLKAGKPVMGLRTATHGFKMSNDSNYKHYTNGYTGSKDFWKGGFGKAILGEKWVAHHGNHGSESTRGIIPEQARNHPITNGIKSGQIWGPTDVYEVNLPVPDSWKVLVRGQVLKGMKPDSEPHPDKNDPMMPVAWGKPYQVPNGKNGMVFTTTMGASRDLLNPAFRRLLVNAAYFLLFQKVPQQTDVGIVGEYNPNKFGFGDFKKGLKPSDYAIQN